MACTDLDTSVLAAAAWQEERKAIAAGALGSRAAAPGAVAAVLENPKRYRTALEQRYLQVFGQKSEPPTPPAAIAGGNAADPVATTITWLEDQLRERVTPSAEDLEKLAEARAQAIEAALVGAQEIDPQRLFVVRAYEAGSCAAAGVARVKLGLR